MKLAAASVLFAYVYQQPHNMDEICYRGILKREKKVVLKKEF
jgi:hypothetical protein